MLYSVQYSSKQYRDYKLGNTLVGQLWLIIPGHVMEKFKFHYSVAYSAPVECKSCNNTGIIEQACPASDVTSQLFFAGALA